MFSAQRVLSAYQAGLSASSGMYQRLEVMKQQQRIRDEQHQQQEVMRLREEMELVFPAQVWQQQQVEVEEQQQQERREEEQQEEQQVELLPQQEEHQQQEEQQEEEEEEEHENWKKGFARILGKRGIAEIGFPDDPSEPPLKYHNSPRFVQMLRQRVDKTRGAVMKLCRVAWKQYGLAPQHVSCGSIVARYKMEKWLCKRKLGLDRWFDELEILCSKRNPCGMYIPAPVAAVVDDALATRKITEQELFRGKFVRGDAASPIESRQDYCSVATWEEYEYLDDNEDMLWHNTHRVTDFPCFAEDWLKWIPLNPLVDLTGEKGEEADHEEEEEEGGEERGDEVEED